MREHNPWISGVITTSILIGGFAMRYVVIYAGQMAQVIASWPPSSLQESVLSWRAMPTLHSRAKTI